MRGKRLTIQGAICSPPPPKANASRSFATLNRAIRDPFWLKLGFERPYGPEEKRGVNRDLNWEFFWNFFFWHKMTSPGIFLDIFSFFIQNTSFLTKIRHLVKKWSKLVKKVPLPAFPSRPGTPTVFNQILESNRKTIKVDIFYLNPT